MTRPSELRENVQELIEKGEMPSLDEVLDALEAVRAEYQEKIIAARREKP